MNQDQKFYRIAQVCQMLLVSRSTLWRWSTQGLFPPRRNLGPNSVAFLKSEVDAWIESRPKVQEVISE